MPENLLTEENMNKLFEKGYEINYRSKEKIVNFMVNKDINKISLLTEIQFDNLIKTNSNILDKYYTQFSGEEKKVLQHLINTFGLYNIIKNMNKSILNQDFINAVGEEFFLKMNKYLIMAETDFKINEVLNIININSVINLYSKIFGSLNSNIESVIKFNKLVSGIHNHQELFLNIIDNINLLDENNLKVLNNLIDNNDKTLNFFKTVDDIINYKQIMFKQNKKDFNNINEIKDAITNMLCNTSYYAAEKFLNTIVNPAKLEDLKKSFNGKDKEDLKCLLNLTKYSSIINLLDRIIKETDITKLNEIKNNLNIALHSENSKVSSPMFSFSEMETDIKKIYAIAYQKTMLNVPKSEQDSEVKIIEDIPDNFGMFVHVMNAYGDGATLEDYKNPRPFGTTYICLSYLNQYQFDSVKRKVIDKDHVTLGFSEFSPDMIQLCGNQDIYSRGGTNNLNLSSNELNFLEPSTMSFKTTRTYNEFVMYREDDKGKSIYPTCVISREEKPLDAEIEAAKNLGVPIVVLNQKD